MAKTHTRSNTCHVNFAKVRSAAEQLSFASNMPLDYLTLQDLQRGEQTARVLAVSAGAGFVAPCGQLNLPTDQSTINQITEVLKAIPPAKPTPTTTKVDPEEYRMAYGGYSFTSPSGRFLCGIMPPSSGDPE